tara:strand:- start:15625 stop:15972 length:348 start_codon:yes stop_codon:yes gene_type:complete
MVRASRQFEPIDDNDDDGPTFVTSARGRQAMKFSGGAADAESLSEWAEQNGWSAETVDDGSGSFFSVVLTNPSANSTVTIPIDSYAVLKDGEFSADTPEEYEADPWILDERGPFL